MANEQKHPQMPFFTPAGRLVAGSVSTKSDKGYQGKQLDKPVTFFALAVDKRQPGIGELLGGFQNHALNSYRMNAQIANLIQQYPLPGPYVPAPSRRPFAWKIQDGDWPDNQGSEGYAGCWILHFQTSLDFGVCDFNGRQMDPKAVHLGMYAMVSGNCAINGLMDHNAGIYLNPGYVKIVADGPLIVTGPTPEQAFAGAPPPMLPPGAQPYIAGQPQQAYAPPPAAAQPQQPAYAPPPAGVQPPPPPAQYAPPPAQPQGNVTPAPAGHAYVPGAQAYAPQGAPAHTTHPAPYQGTAYPSNPPAYAPGAGQQVAPQNTGQFQQPSGGYQQPAGQPVTHMPQGGGAPGAYPSSQPQTHAGPNGYPPVQPHHAFTQGQQ